MITNSIGEDAFEPGDPARVAGELGLSLDTPVVLFSARISPEKHPLDALRIFARACEKRPDVALVVVGSGPQEGALAAEAARLGIRERVHLAGYRVDIADWLALATVFLFTSEREHVSVGLLEAMAAGCAVVATDCPGNDEVLTDGRNALTFAVGKVEDGSSALERCLDDEALRNRIGRGARTTAAEYTTPSMVDAYEQLYRRIARP